MLMCFFLGKTSHYQTFTLGWAPGLWWPWGPWSPPSSIPWSLAGRRRMVGHQKCWGAAEEVVDLGHDSAGAYCLWALVPTYRPGQHQLRDVILWEFFCWQLCIFVCFIFLGCSPRTCSECWQRKSWAEVFSVLFAQAVGDVLILGQDPSPEMLVYPFGSIWSPQRVDSEGG